MKIAYIGPSGVFGGVRAIVEHLNGLTDRGHACTFISTDNQPIRWLPLRAEQRPGNDPGRGYDVVVGTALNTWPAARQIAGAGRAAGLMQMAEWLFAPHNSDAWRGLQQVFATAPLDTTLVISKWLAQMCAQVGRPHTLVRCGVDSHLFYPEPFPDLPKFDGLTIVTEGISDNRAKDQDLMTLRAVRQLRNDEGRPVRFLGFGQVPQWASEFDRYWQLPDQATIRRIYSSGDVFLKASRYEGAPGPDMEAMACGAVVCRAIGAGDDHLHHEENCLKTAYGDQAGFVENLRRLSDAPDLRATLRANALAYVKEKYDWPGAIDGVEKALTGSVSQPKRNYDYDIAGPAYAQMQRDILAWEGGQATFLGELLADVVRPASVIDIGCGPGIYLVPFKPEATVLGVDGAPTAGQVLERDEFVLADLRTDWQAPGVSDLSLCIETGEHLPPDRADYLVDLLTTCSATCFFSAAQPGQISDTHLNEQPRQYWLDKFLARGWELHPANDAVQTRIKANPHCQRVQWLIGNSMLLRRKADGSQ